MQRRSFLKKSGLLAAGTGLRNMVAIAGPFSMEDFADGRVPEDKKLDAAWVKSLYERGNPTAYRKSKNELQYIGMPVGGICCGTVYVGGDGRLWVWDIFNQNQLGAVNKVLPIKLEMFNVKEINNVFGTLYIEPATNSSLLQQGFALVIKHKDATIVKRLHQDDWEEIIFEATYPVATIKYTDKSIPVAVTLQAFSPFIPGNARDSGLPATVQSFAIKNTSADPVSVELIGWLENKMLLNTEKLKKDFQRVNKISESVHGKGISLTVSTENEEFKKAPDYGNMTITTLASNAMLVADAASDKEEYISGIKKFLHLT